MTQTREEFVETWILHMLGLATKGHIIDESPDVLAKVNWSRGLDRRLERLLGRMWDGMQPKSPPAAPKADAAKNGAQTVKGR